MNMQAKTVQSLSRDSIVRWLNRAVHAPSGDNSQPWRFKIDGNVVTMFNIPSADATPFNFRQHGSFLAHGAVIENLSLIAHEEGYEARVHLLPDEANATARITFVPGRKSPSPLAKAIEDRATNRKLYKKTPLQEGHRKELVDSVAGAQGIGLRFVTDTNAIATLARAISTNERLIIENRAVHDFIFGVIRWTRDEECAKPGLYLRTMELPPPVQFIFRHVLRHWFFANLLGSLGLSRIVASQSAQVYSSSSAIGAIILTGESDADFIAAGRAFQRLWLTATSLNMRLHPVTALPYLMQRLNAGEADMFSEKHQALIRYANKEIGNAFDLPDNKHIAMLFRIGYGEEPTAKSAKSPPRFLTG